jgi:hypothetical protein
MSDIAPDLEGLLRQALHPIEPPEDLSRRLETTLANLADLAAEELEAWELSAMRDPRNWGRIVRPAAAIAVGGTAGAALVVLRVRASSKKRRAHATDPLDYAEQTLRAVADETRRLLDR